jgi:hypothetical protein
MMNNLLSKKRMNENIIQQKNQCLISIILKYDDFGIYSYLIYISSPTLFGMI